MDGTLVLGDKTSGGHKALPGARDLLAHLRGNGTPYQVFTNGTARTPSWYASSLRMAGLDVRDEDMMTPSTAAASYLKELGAERVLVLGREPVWRPLVDAGLSIVESPGDGGAVDAVYVGWFREFTFPDLEAAANAIWNGAVLTTASNVPFFAAAGGRAIGSSFAINAMLNALTGAAPIVLGKPAEAAFEVAKTRMGLAGVPSRSLAVVGDDPALETLMANRTGALSIGVATGLNSEEAFAAEPEESRPALALSGVDALLEMLRDPARPAAR